MTPELAPRFLQVATLLTLALEQYRDGRTFRARATWFEARKAMKYARRSPTKRLAWTLIDAVGLVLCRA